MIRIAGAFLVLLGLVSGAALLAQALGQPGVQAGPSLWWFFPLFSLGGYLLFAMGAGAAQSLGLARLLAGCLLALSGVAVLCLVLTASSLLTLHGSSSALWYVFVVAGLLGLAPALPLSKREN